MPLSGTGFIPTALKSCNISPLALDFGHLAIAEPGADLSFALTNSGEFTLSGVVTCDSGAVNIFDPSYSLASGQTKTFYVAVTPTSQGPRTIAIHTGTPCQDVQAKFIGYPRVAPGYLAWGSYGVEGHRMSPKGIAIGPGGDVYVTDISANRMLRFTRDGQFVSSLGDSGSAPGQFSNPYGVALDQVGNLYVADWCNARIQKFSSGGAVLGIWPHKTLALAIDRQGYFYADGDSMASSRKYTFNGPSLATFGTFGQFGTPTGIAVDSEGTVYSAVPTSNSGELNRFDQGGGPLTGFSVGSPVNAVAVDSKGNVYCLSPGNYRYGFLDRPDKVLKFSPAGTLLATWGLQGGGLYLVGPTAIAISPDGYIYVAEYSQIERFGPDQTGPPNYGRPTLRRFVQKVSRHR